jgi:ribonucleoside-triphosphate reductase
MRDVESINKEIEQLKSELDAVEGTPTEIYTRIVGYYRSLNNWNRGKREEYTKRQTFEYGGDAGSVDAPAGHTTTAASVPTGSAAPEPTYESRRSLAVAERPDAGARTGAVSSYAYFFRPTCSSCPPVRTVLERADIGGEHFDVDTEEGFEKAAEFQILATPTVVFFDADGEQVGRAHAPADVQGFLAFAE